MTLKSQIDRFSQNEENFNALITGSAGTTVDLGEAGVVKSVATVIGEIAPGIDKGAWATTTAYVINDIVLESGAYYRCRENHTSGTFATDLTAGKWRLNQGGDSTILTHRGRALDDAFTARFETVAAMIADVNLEIGDKVVTYANQNGASVRQGWDIVDAATGTPDGGSYIDLTGSGLQAKQIFNAYTTPDHFGGGSSGLAALVVYTPKVNLSDATYNYTLNIKSNASSKSISVVGTGTNTGQSLVSLATGHGIDGNDSTDYIGTPSEIRDLRINATGAYDGINIRYKHYLSVKNIHASGGNYGLNAKDTWLCTYENCFLQGAVHGAYLAGANHANTFTRVRFIGSGKANSGTLIDNQGTVPDENASITFDTCDWEFMNCRGVHNKSDRVVTINNPYIEELGSVPFYCEAGKIVVNGGFVVYDSVTYAADIRSIVQLEGGDIEFNGVTIANHSSAGFAGLLSGTLSKAVFYGCDINIPTGGVNILDGAPLGTGPAKRLLVNNNPAFAAGEHLSGGASNPTKLIQPDGRSTRWTCTTAGTHEVRFLTNKAMTDTGSETSFIVVYKSNKNFNVRFQGGNFGGAPVSGSWVLPNTVGVTKTAIVYKPIGKPDTAHNQIVFWDTLAINDYIELIGVYVVNSSEMDFVKDLYLP